jgi:NAD(P)-dependent dehydrogenase (short-subunit alcohol dehydrogenase family)
MKRVDERHLTQVLFTTLATDAAAAIVQTALDAFGSIDILVNNAGICQVVSFEEVTAEDFRQTIEVNLMGTVYTCRAAWRPMKAAGYGRIVNISSGSMTGLAWQNAYAALKGGVYSFTRSLASEGVDLGIIANSVVPGALTRMVYAAQSDASSFTAHAGAHAFGDRLAHYRLPCP